MAFACSVGVGRTHLTMKQLSMILAAAMALALVGCSKPADAPATTGSTGTAASTGGTTPAAAGGIEGEYQVKLAAEQQKQLDAGKAELENLKAKADKGDAEAKTQYEAAKAMMDSAEKAMTEMKLNILPDNKWTMSIMGETGEGTYKQEGNKVSLTLTKKPGGAPLTDVDKKPLEMTWDEAAKTLSGSQGGQTLTFVKK